MLHCPDMARKNNVITDLKRIDELLSRGTAQVVQIEHLKKLLASGKPLRIKYGIDPTGENIHIGHAIPILKLRDFQELGHTVVLIIGDATATVGDTSDKESERPMLTAKDVKKNEKTYLKQIGMLIDLEKTEVHHNSRWLNKLTFAELADEANQFSVADFIARDNIKRRLDKGSRVSLREMLYPLMQGYDSVAIKADVELGGLDQWFNLLSGRALQAHHKQEPQDIITMKLLTAGDGKKMSKSFGNTINLLDSADDMFGKTMRLGDGVIIDCFELCTRVPLDQVRAYSARLNAGENPKSIKEDLAEALVTMYKGTKAAKQARERFNTLFSKKEVGAEDLVDVAVDEDVTLEDIIETHKLSPSRSEFRRLIMGGGVRDLETGEKITDPKRRIVVPINLKLGKRQFIRIIIKRKKKDDTK
ncbi:MAG: tyrosyl-tRNA synthetase, tyrosyl-tRNA synthetase [Candidatus Parcubacteria bacterium]